MSLFVGDDWSEEGHDVYLMDGNGQRLASRRLSEGLDGIRGFAQLMAAHCADPAEVVIGIETDRGLWVTALVEAGHQVYAINPMAMARYRERHHLSGAKSDAADAKVLADLVRTDRHNHRRVAGDSALGEGVKILARGHQTLIWERTRHTNMLRSGLREYYPAALEAFDDLDHPDALAVLTKAPTPATGAKLTVSQIKTALRQGGRQRNLDSRAQTIHTALGRPQLQAPDQVVEAFSAITRAAVGIIRELNRQIDRLETDLKDNFEQHPDADIIRSLPGLGVILGARVLGEFGDDPNRYADAKSRRNYAGTSPVTKASGTKRTVTARHIRNRRLADAADQWAFCSLTHSHGCRTYYDQKRAAGHSHHQALRALANRLVGILHGCLKHHQPYNETIGWAHRTNQAA